MNKNLIIIFTRNPELGKCKPRLAKTIGNENALSIYKILLQHTANVTKKLKYNKAVYYSVKIREHDVWADDIYQKFQQEGEDLGIRMLNAFKKNFQKGYEKIIIIGSDLYDLKQEHIENAFTVLNTNDVVIGPAQDGGYYLIGMKKLHNAIFQNKKWGTSTIRQDTLTDLTTQKVAFLEMFSIL